MPVKFEPLTPSDAVAALLERGGRLDPTFHWTDLWQDEHARSFTVAKSAGFDILGDVHSALQEALEEGQTFRQFSDQLTPTLQRRGWWGRQALIDPVTGEPVTAQLGSPRRLRLIFDVNMRVSYATGQWAGFERRRQTRPFLRYVAVLDDRTRDTHRALHNLVLPVDHEFWNLYAPPNGWNCRCTLQSLSQRDVDRLISEGENLVFEPPEIEFKDWENKRTGETRQIPVGIDPGWAHNPGRAGWRASQGQQFAAKVSAAQPELAEAAIRERIGSRDFETFLNDPAGDMPVMQLPEAASGRTGTRTRVVLLSAETMRKQQQNHPDLTTNDYRSLPDLGSQPDLVLQDGEQTVTLIRRDEGGWHFAATKSTASGRANFLTSFRRTRSAEIERMLNRPSVSVVIDNR